MSLSYGDAQIFREVVESLIAMAVGINTEARREWDNAKHWWIENNILRRADGRALTPKPSPPRLLMWIEVPEVPDQSKIRINFGPDLVSDPTCDLPPLPAPLPPGVTDVGEHNFGGVWGLGPKDTQAAGFRVQWPNCKTPGCTMLERSKPSPWGPGFYQEVKV